jgi:hypothetical protein
MLHRNIRGWPLGVWPLTCCVPLSRGSTRDRNSMRNLMFAMATLIGVLMMASTAVRGL